VEAVNPACRQGVEEHANPQGCDAGAMGAPREAQSLRGHWVRVSHTQARREADRISPPRGLNSVRLRTTRLQSHYLRSTIFCLCEKPGPSITQK
jgi:hypothetical protein